MQRALIVFSMTALVTAPAAAQDLGHRMIGTLGSRAGEQRDAGLYVADRLVVYSASTVRDREGNAIGDDDLQIDALANAFGLAATFEIPEVETYLSLAAAVPIARVSLQADALEASVDRFGLGDVYLQPLGLGWRLPHVDLVTSYALYIPTGLFRLGEGGLSSGHVTHQFSLGSTVFFDTERRYRFSALAGYDVNHPKIGVDITRGETVQIQGGAGALLFDLFDIGVVGAAIWQVGDDRGADIPPALLGARDRAVGAGAELGVIIAAIHGRVGVRYLWETAVESRPEGHVLTFELAIVAWTPSAGDAEEGTSRDPTSQRASRASASMGRPRSPRRDPRESASPQGGGMNPGSSGPPNGRM